MFKKNVLPESVPALRAKEVGCSSWGPNLDLGLRIQREKVGFFQAIGWKQLELCLHPGLDSRQLFFMKQIKFFFQIACYVSLLIPSLEAEATLT